MLRRAAAFLLLWLIARATPDRLLDHPWSEARSASFSIYTTLGESRAREHFRRAIGRAPAIPEAHLLEELEAPSSARGE